MGVKLKSAIAEPTWNVIGSARAVTYDLGAAYDNVYVTCSGALSIAWFESGLFAPGIGAYTGASATNGSIVTKLGGPVSLLAWGPIGTVTPGPVTLSIYAARTDGTLPTEPLCK
jgi:hypothetical protein